MGEIVMSGRSGRGHIIEPQSEIPRLVVMLFGIAGLVAGVILVTLLAPDVIDFFENKEVPNENVTWLTRSWTQEDRANEEVLTLVEILQDNGFKGVYLETNSWHGQTGEFVELPFTQNFVQRFRRNTDTIKLYAWLIIDAARLFDEESRLQLVAAAEQALSEGFDGVQIQARSVPDNSQDLIALLRELRTELGPSAFISLAVPPDRTPADPDVPPSPNVAGNLTWSQDFKRRVILNVNELVLMSHASGLTNPEDYEVWQAYQVATYAEIIENLDLETSFLVALPTYEAELGHDPAVENVDTAILGLKQGIERARAAGDQIDGVGLYPWEQADLLEIEAYWEDWVSREE
jgi:hypothetical protein